MHSYLPVPTAHVYWQRLQQGSLVLDKTEGEIISQVDIYSYVSMYTCMHVRERWVVLSYK